MSDVARSTGSGLVRASVGETITVAAGVLGPMIAQGVIIRRPSLVALADRLQVDRRASGILTRLRERHGGAPLLLRLPGRDLAIVLDPPDVDRVLAGAPRPFTPANREKRAALRHFQPYGVLISDEAGRAVRRPWNEDVLDHREGLHRIHGHVLDVVAEEIGPLANGPEITWDLHRRAVWRTIRRVALGDAARDDERVTDLMEQLRSQANWAFLRPRSTRRLRELGERLRRYVHDGDPASLAGIVARMPGGAGVAPLGQLPHWLFAFDAAVIASYRGLALLAAHPSVQRAVREEDPREHRGLRPMARASMLESLRLWPTTLTILRDSVEDTRWGDSTAPAGTGFAVISSFFHRDAGVLPWADRFEPAIWLDGRAERSHAIVPFSAGPARCPGQSLVLDVTSEILAGLVSRADVCQAGPIRLRPHADLPRTLDQAGLRFQLAAR